MDWSKIIQDIQNIGMTQKEIAEFCNCSQGTISQIKNRYGKKDNAQISVSYEIGTALKNLHDTRVLEK
ncbi:helix-turn-helix domain-containing protein [Alysiella crassa]|uniref:HTH cro/C1-type domain-containing protein n=1 Tax=Alysiella crassa TaxID=153491 RepID=A0A376BM27_9NEIS|nr:helix-turn-helix domain-containing protein [Alysiella crassa]UOP07166.1 helix-turn-helix domain-containing protein [Alysiella crassa]SSY70673.1 Uncharacterised protein [Alysiella crassa]